jgi:orotate phosphoribosyltransferase
MIFSTISDYNTVMSKFIPQQFNQFVLDNHVVGFFPEPIKLVSGRLSSWYVNWRTVAADVYLLDQVSDFVLAFAREHLQAVDCFYGVPEGATKLAVLCQYKWAKQQTDYAAGKYVLSMGRGKPKDHGDPKDKFFVGVPQGQVVILEDVTTTGGSLIKTATALHEAGITVTAALALTNRCERTDQGQTVAEALAELNVQYFAISNALELLPQIVAAQKPSSAIRESIVTEFQTYGEKEITL